MSLQQSYLSPIASAEEKKRFLSAPASLFEASEIKCKRDNTGVYFCNFTEVIRHQLYVRLSDSTTQVYNNVIVYTVIHFANESNCASYS